MMPQRRHDPKRIQKAIEVTQARKEALIELVEAVSTLHLVLQTPLADQHDLKRAARGICVAYCKLQNLEIDGVSAMLKDLEEAKKQAESPIIPAMMGRGRG